MEEMVDEIAAMNLGEQPEPEPEPEPEAEPEAEASAEVEEAEPETSQPDLATMFEALKAEIEALKGALKKEEEATKPEEPQIEKMDFVADVEDDAVFETVSNKESLNTLLNKVYETAVKVATERVLKSLPDVVKNNVEIYTALTEASREFYAENPELRPHAKLVAELYEEFASKNPNWTLRQVLTQVRDEARRRLKLTKPAASQIPPGSKGRAPKPAVVTTPDNKMLREIEEMNKALLAGG